MLDSNSTSPSAADFGFSKTIGANDAVAAAPHAPDVCHWVLLALARGESPETLANFVACTVDCDTESLTTELFKQAETGMAGRSGQTTGSYQMTPAQRRPTNTQGHEELDSLTNRFSPRSGLTSTSETEDSASMWQRRFNELKEQMDHLSQENSRLRTELVNCRRDASSTTTTPTIGSRCRARSSNGRDAGYRSVLEGRPETLVSAIYSKHTVQNEDVRRSTMIVADAGSSHLAPIAAAVAISGGGSSFAAPIAAGVTLSGGGSSFSGPNAAGGGSAFSPLLPASVAFSNGESSFSAPIAAGVTSRTLSRSSQSCKDLTASKSGLRTSSLDRTLRSNANPRLTIGAPTNIVGSTAPAQAAGRPVTPIKQNMAMPRSSSTPVVGRIFQQRSSVTIPTPTQNSTQSQKAAPLIPCAGASYPGNPLPGGVAQTPRVRSITPRPTGHTTSVSPRSPAMSVAAPYSAITTHSPVSSAVAPRSFKPSRPIAATRLVSSIQRTSLFGSPSGPIT